MAQARRDDSDAPKDMNPEEQRDLEVAQEYKPGELAPAIITPSKVWRPDDLKAIDPTLVETLKSLISTCSQQEEPARRFSVLSVWEGRSYDRGHQYLEEGQGGGWQVYGTQVGSGQNSKIASDDANLYPTNIYSSQGDIITSALCRGAIKLAFSPGKSKDPMDVQTSDEANKYKYIWGETNDQNELQRSTVGLAWTDPRGVMWTRSVADKARFGVNDKGDPKIVEVSNIYGVLESKLPMMVDRLDQASYAQVYEEVDYAIARAAYPWMGNKIKPSWGTAGELEFERIARINTRLGMMGRYITGTAGVRECTMGYTWYRVGIFYDDKVKASQREFFLKEFSKGIFIVMAGPEFVCCWTESMDDHLSMGMYSRGFGQDRRALGSSDIPIQKRINIWADLWDKYVRGSIPIGLLESEAFDAEAMSKLEASTTRFVEVALDTANQQTMQSIVGQTPTPQPIPGFSEMLQWYLGPLIQSIDGGTPALFGGGEGADNTVGATQIRLQQALERIGTAWLVSNKMFAEACSQAVRCCADNGNTEISSNSSEYGDITVNPENLKGNFKCKAETINGIPESGAQREAKILQILEMANSSQQIQSIVGTPSNAREIINGLHMDDVITVDEADSEDGAMETVEILLESEPLENPQWHELNRQYREMSEVHEQAKQLATQAAQEGRLHPEDTEQGQQLEQKVGEVKKQLDGTPQYLPSVEVPDDQSVDYATITATLFSFMQKPEFRKIRRAAAKEDGNNPDPKMKQNWAKFTNILLYWKANKELAEKFAKPVPAAPKVSLSGKLDPNTISELLGMAGIQVSPPKPEPSEQTQETIRRNPMAEIKTRTTRKL